mmetsp:Transcript_14212/g.34661  ORF Transcript_14212/g.34661 Transcript_14212/m.34661 type:complete len:223 (+) Transcript_14212:195-863(+)|eukprot:CAMPEP_0114516800 /NCGR_PEP_ID=MMETSP0109-20121206/17530_1 /TAXON_ID=29199 /ORGANISM="Chlorarachnion reptans, Strain CCCM449" /LENGTH=222 /DNA_ID=CAMNT_0001697231 /DNA_START=129 /DNA_END=797 /DNA_ORIENTATION=-
MGNSGSSSKQYELGKVWEAVFEHVDLNQHGEVTKDEVNKVLKMHKTDNPLSTHLKKILEETKGDYLSKAALQGVFKECFKECGLSDENTYEECKTWIETLKEEMGIKAEAREERMKAIYRKVYKEMDRENKGEVTVARVKSYLHCVKDPYGVMKSYLESNDDSIISEKDFLQKIEDHITKNGKPRTYEVDTANTDYWSIVEEKRGRQADECRTACVAACPQM